MFMIEGEWSGYRSEQRRLSHRHYVSSKKEADRISAIGYSIQFTDGTELILTVREVRRRKEPEKLQYRELIDDCVRYGVNSVYALIAAKKPKPAETGSVSSER